MSNLVRPWGNTARKNEKNASYKVTSGVLQDGRKLRRKKNKITYSLYGGYVGHTDRFHGSAKTFAD